MRVYSDSKRNDERGNWGFMVVNKDEEIVEKKRGQVIGKDLTDLRMGLMALARACIYIDVRSILKEVQFYTSNSTIINYYEKQKWKEWQENNWRDYSNTPIENQDFWKLLIPYFQRENFKFHLMKKIPEQIVNEL